jgi:peroxiredoxin
VEEGPLVVMFYRGGWCSYCNLELHAWQQRLPRLRGLGGQLVAISLEGSDDSLNVTERNGIAFPVLRDVDMEAANGFNVALSLPPELVDLYGASGATQPVLSASGQWILPVPATFVVDARGEIRFADVDVDFRRRADPEEVLAVVKRLQATAAV